MAVPHVVLLKIGRDSGLSKVILSNGYCDFAMDSVTDCLGPGFGPGLLESSIQRSSTIVNLFTCTELLRFSLSPNTMYSHCSLGGYDGGRVSYSSHHCHRCGVGDGGGHPDGD